MGMKFWAFLALSYAETDHECAVETAQELCHIFDDQCGKVCNNPKSSTHTWIRCMENCVGKHDIENLECKNTRASSSFLSNMINYVQTSENQNYDCVTQLSCSIWRYCAQGDSHLQIKRCLDRESSTRFEKCDRAETDDVSETDYTCYNCEKCAFFLPSVNQEIDCLESLAGCCLSLDGCYTEFEAEGNVNRGCI